MNKENMYVKMGIDGWQAQVNLTSGLIEKLTDDQLMQEVAPGRNRGIYLLGHLAAVHDLMMPLLRFENALYPELKPLFLDAPDKSIEKIPGVAQLRGEWKEVNEKLSAHIKGLPAEEWFTRHANITEEDFVKEPHRNRLNVLLGRTTHLSYHRGQLALLPAKKAL
jgi:hypothetical protein